METNYGLHIIIIFLINLYELNSYDSLFLSHNFKKRCQSEKLPFCMIISFENQTFLVS